MVRLSALLSATSVALSVAVAGAIVTQDKLLDFVVRDLRVPRADAKGVVAAHEKKVNAGNVTSSQMEEMLRMMRRFTAFREVLLQEFFPALEAGVDPSTLHRFFKVLYWDLKFHNEKGSDSAEMALRLAKVPADPDALQPMWLALSDQSNVDLPTKEARRWAVDLVAAGADPITFLATYKELPTTPFNETTKEPSMFQGGLQVLFPSKNPLPAHLMVPVERPADFGEAWKKAVLAAVSAGAGGLQARYAKNGKLYSARDFHAFYGDSWFVRWLEAPLEKRIGEDCREYTALQFQALYREAATSKWAQAPEAPQPRMGQGDKIRPLEEYVMLYEDDWQVRFLKSALVVAECLTPDEEKLAQFVQSSAGLAVASRRVAERIARAHAKKVVAARFSLSQLKALRDTMVSPALLGMTEEDLRDEFFKIVEAGVDPQKLSNFFEVLHSSRFCGMDREEAREAALKLAKTPATPVSLKSMWMTLMDTWADVPGKEGPARWWVVDLVAAGADETTFHEEFTAGAKHYGPFMFSFVALKAAYAGVRKGPGGMQARYGESGHLLSVVDFHSKFEDRWLVEWLQAPAEKRLGSDGKEYTAWDFKVLYGQDVSRKWRAATPALQRRITAEGQVVTLADFIARHPGFWEGQFKNAAVVGDDCAMLNPEDCEKESQLCQWGPNGDWMDSCVVKSRTTGALFV